MCVHRTILLMVHGWDVDPLTRMTLGKFHHDLTDPPKPIDDGECKGNHPQMAETYRLVKYYNLPRLLCSLRGS